MGNNLADITQQVRGRTGTKWVDLNCDSSLGAHPSHSQIRILKKYKGIFSLWKIPNIYKYRDKGTEKPQVPIPQVQESTFCQSYFS